MSIQVSTTVTTPNQGKNSFTFSSSRIAARVALLSSSPSFSPSSLLLPNLLPANFTAIMVAAPSSASDAPSSVASSSSSFAFFSATNTPALTDVARTTLQRGTWLGMLSLGLLFLAYSLTMPHIQSHYDALKCDSFCQGSLASLRSLLKLVGAAVMGRWSDGSKSDNSGDQKYSRTNARRRALWTGLAATSVSLILAHLSTTKTELWYSVIPTALEQNMHIFRAVLSDYQEAVPAMTAAERASSAGSLGMSVGLALMLGPLLGARFLANTYEQATYVALLALVAAAVTVYMLPNAEYNSTATMNKSTEERKDEFQSSRRHVLSFLDVPSVRSPAALFLLSTRLLSALAFHIFQTISAVSLRERFEFGPKEYGTFFSVVGFFFAMSQGPMATALIHRFGHTSRGRVHLLLACSLCTAVLRYTALYTRNIPLVYASFAVMVSAYGVLATIVTADTSHLVPPQEAGAFFGVLAAVESGAGMLGPLLGGLLSKMGTQLQQKQESAAYTSLIYLPLMAILVLSAANLILMALGYEKLILNHQQDTSTAPPSSSVSAESCPVTCSDATSSHKKVD